MKPKLLVSLLMLSLAFSPAPALASLKNEVEGMWKSTMTPPSTWETQRRFGASLGSVSLRSPQRQFNLVSFDPPRIEAGCRGVSLYMGAFSFINAEEFRQLLRNIGSAAIGFFFEMALQTLSGSLHSVLSGLAEKVQQLNQMFQNTCRISKAIGYGAFSEVKDMLPEWLKAKSEDQKVADNQTGDQAAAQKSINENGTADANETMPAWGNFLWRALSRQHTGLDSGDSFGFSGLSASESKQIKEYIISMFGTVVQMKQLSDGSNCAAGKQCSPQTVPYEFSLTFEQFLTGNADSGNSQGATYWRCPESNPDPVSGCTKMERTPFNFKGISAVLHNKFYGTDDETDINPRSGSIVDTMRKGLPLNASQTAFLNSFQTPVLWGLLEAQKDASGFDTVVVLSKPFMARELSMRVGESILQSVNKAYTGNNGKQDSTPKLPDFEARRTAIQTTLSQLRKEAAKTAEDYNTFITAVRNFRQTGSPTTLVMR
ncbi:conjugal transfer protein TraH [Chromobacterium sp. IIBBL 290-4]|uniref:conjugal transfer protein TraH n=1 Tax=Chromobacterium sp. IIBBL 290-4 TaxID=2953890 RepID=UPI0020B7E145|nr:conjugal transfer protein TraH [Chromobacterium sp. IIBBL 290-4]UTH74230.1 conjugal transfer protein TraH [Chromobacterium sp. IIBBL 290-4]